VSTSQGGDEIGELVPIRLVVVLMAKSEEGDPLRCTCLLEA
jgi:hypothetical protein